MLDIWEKTKQNKYNLLFLKNTNKCGKKACFRTKDAIFVKLFDDVTGDTLTITRDITRYNELDMTIEFFDANHEDEILAKTSLLHIVVNDAVECDDVENTDENVVILDKLIDETTKCMEAVNNLDIDIENSVITITKKDGSTKSENVKGMKGDKGDKGEPGKFKLHIVEQLPTTGEDGALYLIKKENASDEDLYNEYIYADGKWNLIGNTHIDLSEYYTIDEIDNLLNEKEAGVELYGTYEDGMLTINLNNENGKKISGLAVEIPQYQEIHYLWDKTTGEEAKDLFQMVYNAYRNGKLLNVDLKDGNKMYKLTNISQPNSIGSQFWCQFRTIDWYTNGTDMVFLQTINAVLNVAGSIVQDIEIKESVNQFALVREYDGKNGALPTNNSKEYTPTGNYEPATKLYVDRTHYVYIKGYSTSKTQTLKNINGTLTWVDG